MRLDKGKIDDAVKVMQALSPEERAAVNYTVEREARKRTRKPKAQANAQVELEGA